MVTKLFGIVAIFPYEYELLPIYDLVHNITYTTIFLKYATYTATLIVGTATYIPTYVFTI